MLINVITGLHVSTAYLRHPPSQLSPDPRAWWNALGVLVSRNDLLTCLQPWTPEPGGLPSVSLSAVMTSITATMPRRTFTNPSLPPYMEDKLNAH